MAIEHLKRSKSEAGDDARMRALEDAPRAVWMDIEVPGQGEIARGVGGLPSAGEIGTDGARLCVPEGGGGHAGQWHVHVRRYVGRKLPRGAAAD